MNLNAHKLLGREKSALEAVVETIDTFLVTGTDDVEGLLELAVEAEDQETFDEAQSGTCQTWTSN